MQNTFLLQSSVITGGKEGTTENTATTTTTTAEVGTSTEAPATGSTTFGGMNTISLILIYAVVIAAMYYFTIRPAKKREKLIQAKQDEIRLGDAVVTTSGMHGKVVDIGSDTFNIEFGTNKGVIIPVNKKDVLPVNINLASDDKKEATDKKAAKAETTETK